MSRGRMKVIWAKQLKIVVEDLVPDPTGIYIGEHPCSYQDTGGRIMSQVGQTDARNTLMRPEQEQKVSSCNPLLGGVCQSVCNNR
jgi:hypothetical protein